MQYRRKINKTAFTSFAYWKRSLPISYVFMILWIIRLLRYRQPKPKANHVNNNWPELHARKYLQITMADKGKIFIEFK